MSSALNSTRNAKRETRTVFIGIGSNLGDRKKNCLKAISQLKKTDGIRVLKISNWYRTKPEGNVSQPDYINGALKISVKHSPEELLKILLKIEENLGRPTIRKKGEPRTIDLDILFYEDLIMRKRHLKIPHPRLQKRIFVLSPLCDIAPLFKHPVLSKTIRELKNSSFPQRRESKLDSPVKPGNDKPRLCSR